MKMTKAELKIWRNGVGTGCIVVGLAFLISVLLFNLELDIFTVTFPLIGVGIWYFAISKFMKVED